MRKRLTPIACGGYPCSVLALGTSVPKLHEPMRKLRLSLGPCVVPRSWSPGGRLRHPLVLYSQFSCNVLHTPHNSHEVHNSVVFTIVTVVQLSLQSILECFSSPQKETPSPSLSPWHSLTQLSVFVDLPVLDVSCEWNRQCDLCLACH